MWGSGNKEQAALELPDLRTAGGRDGRRARGVGGGKGHPLTSPAFFFLSLLLSSAGDAALLLIIHQPGSSNCRRSERAALAAASLPVPASRSRRAGIPDRMMPSAAGGGRLLL